MNILQNALLQFLGTESIDGDLHDEDLSLQTEHLKNFHDDMQAQFNDLLKINVYI